MKRSTVLAAATASGLTAAQITAFEAQLTTLATTDDDEEDLEDNGDDEEEEDRPDADSKTAPGGDDPADDSKPSSSASPTVAGGAAPDAIAPDGQTVLAILDLPEAKGREQLARKLAAMPGMTADSAKALLSAAPKRSALAVEDPPVAASGGEQAKGAFAEGVALAAQLKTIRGGKSRR